MACASVQPVREPARFIAETNPKVVYVTHRNRSLIAIGQPRISGDSLLGVWEGSARPVGVPLSQVTSIQARQHNKTRTTLFIVGLTAFTAGTAYALALAGNGEPKYCDYTSWPPRDCP
jgi:hypothetical protein